MGEVMKHISGAFHAHIELLYFSMMGNHLPFLPPGGSIGPIHVLQHLFSEKSQNCYNLNKLERK
jgi:hypothetical protein